MATYTSNYELEKPAQTDLYNVDVFNDNADTIDTVLFRTSQNFAPIETSSRATRDYAVGSFLVYNSHLYKVTTAIATSGTISPNTNCTRVNVGGQISAINNVLPAGFSVGANSTYTNSTDYSRRGQYMLVFSHTSATALRGIYLVMSANVVAPIVDASGLTVSISAGTLTVVNGTGSTATGLIV